MNKPYYVIGLTGSLAAGKTTVAKILEKKGCLIFSADDVAKKLYENPDIKQKIVDRFGEITYDREGKINRSFMADRIFKNKVDLQWVESLIHPAVWNEFLRLLKNLKEVDIVVYDAPLLLETMNNKRDIFDLILVIDAPIELRKIRAMKRSNLSEEQFFERENKQIQPEIKRKLADYVIIKEKDIENLEKKIKNLLIQIKKK